MKSNKSKVFFVFFLLLAGSAILYSCQKSDRSNGKARIEVRLTDSPDPIVKEVWVDVKEVRINMEDSDWITLDGAHPGLYNLLDLTDGRDTLLADALIPAGKISQIRLILGDNNFIITNNGEKIKLSTPSAEQSGLKVQIHQEVAGGILYRLILDFDAGKSIVKAGNSGKYNLKPVLRIISFVPSGGNVSGVVVPDSVRTAIYALQGVDTIASTFTDTTNGKYWFGDLPSGSYSFSFEPSDVSYKPTQKNVTVVLGQNVTVDTVFLQK